MSELGDLYRDMREESKQRRESNLSSSINALRSAEVEFKQPSDTHLIVGAYDFWPSTGLFIHRPTGKRGRGVFNLIRKVKPIAMIALVLLLASCGCEDYSAVKSVGGCDLGGKCMATLENGTTVYLNYPTVGEKVQRCGGGGTAYLRARR